MRIAINGVGVGGPTLAYWLRKYGHEPVLFEKSPELRKGGYLIDFWGLGYEIAERMGLIPELRKKSYQMKELSIVDSSGHQVAGLKIDTLENLLRGRYMSLARSDIASTIFGACEGIETHFGVSICGIEQSSDSARITLSNGKTENFDLVVGADGLHSKIRSLCFGPQSQFERHLGCHVAVCRIEGHSIKSSLRYVSHTLPKRQVGCMALRDHVTLVLFIWRSELMAEIPKTEREQKDVLRQVFGDMGWEVPQFLDGIDDSSDFYFDRVSQIHLEHWSTGRVALLGDAAACASLLAGEGTGLAIIEAYVLAGELHRAQGDYRRSFANYERLLRSFLSGKQKSALGMINFFTPKNMIAMKLRNLAVNLASTPCLSKLILGRAIRDDFSLPDYLSDHQIEVKRSGPSNVSSRGSDQVL